MRALTILHQILDEHDKERRALVRRGGWTSGFYRELEDEMEGEMNDDLEERGKRSGD